MNFMFLKKISQDENGLVHSRSKGLKLVQFGARPERMPILVILSFEAWTSSFYANVGPFRVRAGLYIASFSPVNGA